MLAIQLEATYRDDDEYFELNETYPVVAITKSDDIDTAVDCLRELMSENGWGDFNFSRYGTVKGSDEAPKSFGEPKEWKKSLEESGAIYIVYRK